MTTMNQYITEKIHHLFFIQSVKESVLIRGNVVSKINSPSFTDGNGIHLTMIFVLDLVISLTVDQTFK